LGRGGRVPSNCNTGGHISGETTDNQIPFHKKTGGGGFQVPSGTPRRRKEKKKKEPILRKRVVYHHALEKENRNPVKKGRGLPFEG